MRPKLASRQPRDDRSVAPGARGRFVELGPLTTFRIGGRAREFYAPRGVDELDSLLTRLAGEGKDPFVLGGGANVLFPDGDYDRPVISTGGLRDFEIRGELMTVSAGARLNALIRSSIQAGLGGLEGFVGIPGTCGGAVSMNAGGAGWAFGERVVELGVVPLRGGGLQRLKGSDVPWAYRTSGLDDCVVAWARLQLCRDQRARLKERASRLMRRKVATQPLHSPSAGCIFRNPNGGAAGQLIERLGLKGVRRGGAAISQRHANFIVNASGEATAADVKALVADVIERVASRTGIELETEVVLA